MSLFAELKRRNVIRVATAYAVSAWLIIQIAETTLPVYGFSDEAVRLIITLLAIGFIPVVIGAWVLQVTPEGIRIDSGVADEAPASERAKRLLDRMIIVVLVLGISYFAFDKFVLAPERAAELAAEVEERTRTEALTGFYGDRSIAVLPFDNLSSDPEQQYLGQGIAEEVLNLLARIRDLRVISRSSAFALTGLNLEIPEIAERLDVAHILEGSIRRSGNRLRITAQLIEARTDTHLWSETYTHEIGDEFAIQDEIAADVVANLQFELLSAAPRARHIDPEVLELVAQAYQLLQARPDDIVAKLEPLVTRALEIDPDYIPALEYSIVLKWWLVDEVEYTWEEMHAYADATYERILELDPNSARPDFWYAFFLSGEFKLEEAAARYLSGLEKDLTIPDSIRLAGYLAQHMGKLDAAARLQRHALSIDPLCHQCRRRYAETLMFAGEYEEAGWQYERYLAHSSEGWDEYVLLLLLQGRAEDALAYTDTIEAGGGDFDHDRDNRLARRAMAFYSLGRSEEFEAALAELRSSDNRDRRSVTLRLTEVAAWTGDNDFAFEKLHEMAASGFQYLHRRTFSPIWRNLHDDPRWLEYREFNGTSPERLDAIEFDPDLPD